MIISKFNCFHFRISPYYVHSYETENIHSEDETCDCYEMLDTTENMDKSEKNVVN